MPRSTATVTLILALAVMASACAAAGTTDPDTDAGADPSAPLATSPATTAPPATPAPTPGAPAPGTDLDACEIVTAADIETALELEPGTVSDGELRETPTSLSPGHTECRYTGDWGGLIVNLTPEDGANLYRAARGSYADASDREVAGADGAFWSAQNKRGFFWKGAVTVMLQVSHLAVEGDREVVVVALGQAATDRVD
jgi:hypothetical protein